MCGAAAVLAAAPTSRARAWVGAAAQGDAKRRPASCARRPRGRWAGGAPPAQRPRRGGNVTSRSRTISTLHVADKGWVVDGAISRCSCHRPGGKPRRAGCPHARAAFLFAGDATGVTRRGWAGRSRDALPYSRGREPRRTGCRVARTRFAARRSQRVGAAWKERVPLATHCATCTGGSRAAPVARAQRTRFAARGLQRVRRGEGGSWFSRCTDRQARAGAAARSVAQLFDQFTQLTRCNGRDAARAGGFLVEACGAGRDRACAGADRA